jgi:glyceraldehyde 3-phosphate dehydrogenase
MSKIKVGINGFGRIGRLAFRAALKRNDIEIVGINDLLDVDYIAYMLRYDTVHGRFDGKVEVKDGKLVVNGQSIRITAEKETAMRLEQNMFWSAQDCFLRRIQQWAT